MATDLKRIGELHGQTRLRVRWRRVWLLAAMIVGSVVAVEGALTNRGGVFVALLVGMFALADYAWRTS